MTRVLRETFTWTRGNIGWKLLRIYIWSWGALIVVTSWCIFLVVHKEYFRDTAVPELWVRIILMTIFWVYALLLLLPYRRTLTGWLFVSRLTLLFLGSAWMIHSAAEHTFNYIDGVGDWTFFFLGVPLLLSIVIGAPLSLWMSSVKQSSGASVP